MTNKWPEKDMKKLLAKVDTSLLPHSNRVKKKKKGNSAQGK